MKELIKELKEIDNYFIEIRENPEKIKEFEKDILECGFGKIKPGPLSITETISLYDLWIYNIKVNKESIDEMDIPDKEKVLEYICNYILKYRHEIDKYCDKIIITGEKSSESGRLYDYIKIIPIYKICNNKEYNEKVIEFSEVFDNHIFEDDISNRILVSSSFKKL